MLQQFFLQVTIFFIWLYTNLMTLQQDYNNPILRLYEKGVGEYVYKSFVTTVYCNKLQYTITLIIKQR